MNIGKLSYFARKIHRLFVVIIVLLGFLMMNTGATMNFPQFMPIDPIVARTIHGNISTIFSFVFGVMMLTGLIMYITPWILKKMTAPPPPKLSN